MTREMSGASCAEDGAMQGAGGIAIEAAAAGSYAHGIDCIWHGASATALVKSSHGGHFQEGELLCPFCAGPVRRLSSEGFWAEVRAVGRNAAEFEAMLRWSENRCFPNYDTLENAWRQATTE